MDIYNTVLCDLVQTRRTELQCYLLVLVPKPKSSSISIKPGVTTDSRKEKKQHTMCREETLEVEKGTRMPQVL